MGITGIEGGLIRGLWMKVIKILGARGRAVICAIAIHRVLTVGVHDGK